MLVHVKKISIFHIRNNVFLPRVKTILVRGKSSPIKIKWFVPLLSRIFVSLDGIAAQCV